MWAHVFRNKAVQFRINTNNGLERQHETLKHTYLRGYRNCTLSELIQVLHSHFFPDSYKKYVQGSEYYRKFRQEIPSFLRNRPREFVTHVLQRWISTLDDKNVCCLNEDSGIFTVNSESDGEKNYTVILGGKSPSCSCVDWKKFLLPCKHMCAILRCALWQWEKISPSYTQHALFSLDNECISTSIDFYTEANEKQEAVHETVHEAVCSPVKEITSLPPRRRNQRTQMVVKCVQTFKKVIDTVYLIQDIDCLTALQSAAEELLNKANSYVTKDHGMPIIPQPTESGKKLDLKPLPKRKYGKPKQPGAQRFGVKAEAQKMDVWETVVTSEEFCTESTSPWITVKGINLSYTHRKEISDGIWLDDNIINVCQNLLSLQYPTLGGLVDTVILSQSTTNIVPMQNMVQIHHLGAHWLMSAAIGGKITVYDSLPFSGIAENLREQLIKMYVPLFTGVDKVVTVNYICSQKQEGGNDCGLFAIANCLALANKLDPCTICFEQDKMRQHLVFCLDQKKLERFPFLTSEQKVKTNKVRLTMFFTCHLYSKEAMVMCDKCKMWLHFSCAGIAVTDKRINSKKKFFCNKCKTNKQK